MIVNVDPYDKTWQVHLNGLLEILRKSHTLVYEKKALPLLKAMQIMDCRNVRETISTQPVCDIAGAGILLDIAKLRLNCLDTEFTKLFADASPPRKIDVQKLRRLIKELHDNLRLMPSMLPEEPGTADGKGTLDEGSAALTMPSSTMSFNPYFHGYQASKILPSNFNLANY
jgi:hypothetical protein